MNSSPTQGDFLIWALSETFKDSKYQYVKDSVLDKANKGKGEVNVANVETLYNQWVKFADNKVADQNMAAAAAAAAADTGYHSSDDFVHPSRRGGMVPSRKARSSRKQRRFRRTRWSKESRIK